MEDINLPILLEREFVPIRISGKRNIHHFIKRLFMYKSKSSNETRLKCHHWNKITLFKVLTDRKISTELEILHAKFICRNPNWKDMDFYSSFPGLTHLTPNEFNNIKFNHCYGRNGYRSIAE